MAIKLSAESFEPEKEIAQFDALAAGSGAIVSFLGKVRTKGDCGAVTGLHIEHYPEMTERSIAQFIARANKKWALDHILVIHRVGDIKAGDPIVLVCAAAAHRRDAFNAADFLMDYLKTRAFFWKKEITANGAAWLEPRKDDYDDAIRWNNRKEKE